MCRDVAGIDRLHSYHNHHKSHMSYQVLARKWRPQNFEAMVGQQHVLRALTTALTEERLHHAYLFTGTRGVGKTTIARIFAKSLNCEQGISATPCGECRSCQEIAEGRHADLIEVDAASRTKVEDTRELLENVQYAPTRGRFKIYLIDEVHMLSGHSFNALLKTLEEPPPHIKFLFATTDPQKLPVTILSRCLQFNLKRMSQERIVDYLRHILTEEQVNFEAPALQLLARAADGSMRDALSLTDQAIVTGQGQVNEEPIRDMLGMLPQGLLAQLLLAIANDQAQQAFDIIEQLADLSTDFTQATENLLSFLHQVALAQVLSGQQELEVKQVVEVLAPEDVQLYYQMALHGRRDLALSPDARSGFEMLVLRMLAFSLDNPEAQTAPKKKIEPAVTQAKPAPMAPEPVVPQPKPAAPVPVAPKPVSIEHTAQAAPKPVEPPVINESITAEYDPMDEYAAYASMQDQFGQQPQQTQAPVAPVEPEPKPEPKPTPAVVEAKPEIPVAPISIPTQQPASEGDNEWHHILPQLALSGMAKQVANDCLLASEQDQQVILAIDESAEGLKTQAIEQSIQEALTQYYSHPVAVKYQTAAADAETPAKRKKRLDEQRQQQAETAIAQDATVKQLCDVFDATVVKGSIRPHTN